MNYLKKISINSYVFIFIFYCCVFLTNAQESATSSANKPNLRYPLTLIVRITSDDKILLNGEEEVITSLLGHLIRVFDDRKESGAFREGTNEVEKTVWIVIPSSSKNWTRTGDIKASIIKALERAGASPIKMVTEKVYEDFLAEQRASATYVYQGKLNNKVISLVQPTYPENAKGTGASGVVNVLVVTDSSGDVISAYAMSGHPLLREAAVKAVYQSRFEAAVINGQVFGVKGIVTYNFNPQSNNQNKLNYLVFSSQKDGNQEVYQLDLTTGLATNLSLSGEDDGYPRCSPDGRKIAFATNRDGYWEIYLMNRDGSGQQNLTKNRDGNGYMDWSPDGQALVFASTRNNQKNNEIYTIRADGSGLKRLTNHSAEDVHPAWSPDGRKIAFASERDGNRQIYVMNADGTNVIRLMNNRWYDDYPAWSPNGSQIAFSSDRDSKASDRLDIYTANAGGTNIKRITSHPSDDRHPAWSPDGTLLAFASNRDGDHDIYTVRADGTELKKVFSSKGEDEHPHWCGNTERP